MSNVGANRVAAVRADVLRKLAIRLRVILTAYEAVGVGVDWVKVH